MGQSSVLFKQIHRNFIHNIHKSSTSQNVETQYLLMLHYSEDEGRTFEIITGRQNVINFLTEGSTLEDLDLGKSIILSQNHTLDQNLQLIKFLEFVKDYKCTDSESLEVIKAYLANESISNISPSPIAQRLYRKVNDSGETIAIPTEELQYAVLLHTKDDSRSFEIITGLSNVLEFLTEGDTLVDLDLDQSLILSENHTLNTNLSLRTFLKYAVSYPNKTIKPEIMEIIKARLIEEDAESN